MKYNWAGIDYGAKLAGTTVICYTKEKKLHLLQVDKKVDADKWLLRNISELKISKIYLDAPLSIPKAYFGSGDNYFYRECDKLTSAMSPMFLGGLTARAVKLKSQLSEVTVIETYPAYLIRNILSLSEIYLKKKKYSDEIMKNLIPLLPISLTENPKNWHQLDALLCWFSGYRFSLDKATIIGDRNEGQIVV